VALDRGHGHIKRPADLLRAHIFLVAQNENSPRYRGERAYQLMQPAAEQWVALARGCRLVRQFGQIIPVHRYLRLALPPADAIDGSVHGHPAQPIENMRIGGKLAQLGVQFQENILGRLLGHRAIAEDAESNAEDHALVFQHQVTEALLVVFCSEYQVVT